MTGVSRKFKSITEFPEYGVRSGMIQRCTNPSSPAYNRYGGRGIKVCDSWLDDFWNFYGDMGPRPSDEHTLDRIDNDGNYEPGNCRWATWDVQANNRSNNWTEEQNEILKTMWTAFRSAEDIAEELGKSVSTIRQQAFRLDVRRDKGTYAFVQRFPELFYLIEEQGEDAFREAAQREVRKHIARKQAERRRSKEARIQQFYDSRDTLHVSSKGWRPYLTAGEAVQ